MAATPARPKKNPRIINFEPKMDTFTYLLRPQNYHFIDRDFELINGGPGGDKRGSPTLSGINFKSIGEFLKI